MISGSLCETVWLWLPGNKKKKKKKNVEKEDFGASKMNNNIYINIVRKFLLSW